MGHVYLIKSDSGSYKIGRSVDARARLKQLTGFPFGITLDHVIETNNAGRLESFLHKMFAHRRIKYEWFALVDADVAYIKSVARANYPSLNSAEPMLNWDAESLGSALGLLELIIGHGGGNSDIIITAPRLGIGGGTWSRGVNALKPHVATRPGRRGGTRIVSKTYTTVALLYEAIRNERVKLK